MSDTDFAIGQNNHETQAENRNNAVEENFTLNNTNNSTQVDSSQVDMHTFEKNLVRKMESVTTTDETRVQVAILTAIKDLLIPTVELTMKSVNASSGQDVDKVIPDRD